MTRTLVALVAVLVTVATARAQELDAAFAAAADYTFGGSVAALRVIEVAVAEASAEKEGREVMEPLLLALLESDDATIDAKRFACRQLGLVGGAKAATTLGDRLGDPDLCAPACGALGRIGSVYAERVLIAAVDAPPDAATPCLVEAIDALASRRSEAAIPSLGRLAGSPDPEVADAAVAGLGTLRTEKAANLLLWLDGRGMGSVDVRRDAMLRCARRMEDIGERDLATRLLKAVTAGPDVPPALAVAAHRAMHRRGRGLDELVDMLEDPDTRGDALAIVRTSPDKRIVTKLAGRLTEFDPDVRAAVIVALGERGHPAALPAVLGQLYDPAVTAAVIEALAQFGDFSAVAPLTRIAVDDRVHGEAALAALRTMRAVDVDSAITRAIADADGPQRAVLVSTLGYRAPSNAVAVASGRLDDPDWGARNAAYNALAQLGGAAALAAVRDELGGDNHMLAVEAMSAWADDAAAEDLGRLMENDPDPQMRSRALFGYVRLAAMTGTRSDEETLAMYDRAVAASSARRHLKAALGILRSTPTRASLDRAVAAVDESSAGAMAADTALIIAPVLGPEDRHAALAALDRIRTRLPDMDARVTSALDALEMMDDYVLAWQVAGPYRRKDTDGAAILDVPFAPETDPGSPAIVWQDVRPTDVVVDLHFLADPSNCCAYARTVLYADTAMEVRLDLASDDGLRVWLNDALVHDNNVMRGLSFGSDQVTVTLREGANPLLLKVSQGGGDWSFACRVRAADGGPPVGVTAATRPLPAAPPPDAIVLFDGDDTSAWRHPDGGPLRWNVEDGAMVVQAGTGTAATTETFEDFTLHLEFATPADSPPDATGQARGNSGVYIHGAYEVQVLDSWGISPAKDTCGAIYGVRAANVNASRRPGEWQAYDIDFIAPRWSDDGEKLSDARITVRHNGVLIHDDVRVPGPTGAGGPAPHGAGPIHLQDHGNPVRYRNIWVVPHDARTDEPSASMPPLFDGGDLDDWERRGGEAVYSVDGSTIIGETRPNQPNTFLCTKQHYDDFVLDLEFLVDDELNSGVQVRSNSDPAYQDGRVHGYQVEIDPSERAWTAGIYDESRRGWLASLAENEPARAAFRPGEWNRLRVIARGDVIRTYLNDVPAAMLVDGTTADGFIALQVHGVGPREDPLRVRWRGLRLRALP